MCVAMGREQGEEGERSMQIHLYIQRIVSICLYLGSIVLQCCHEIVLGFGRRRGNGRIRTRCGGRREGGGCVWRWETTRLQTWGKEGVR